MHIYQVLFWNNVTRNTRSGFLHCKEGLQENCLHGRMSQWGTIGSMASMKEVIEGTYGAFQLFEVGGKMIQEKFGTELPGSGVAKGLHILQCLDGSPTLYAGLLERDVRTDFAWARVNNTDSGEDVNK